ncbi:SRPBCC family protein [Nostocoides sp.]
MSEAGPQFEPLLREEIVVNAPPPRVWELVSDVRRMGEWSPQVVSTRLRDGFEASSGPSSSTPTKPAPG